MQCRVEMSRRIKLFLDCTIIVTLLRKAPCVGAFLPPEFITTLKRKNAQTDLKCQVLSLTTNYGSKNSIKPPPVAAGAAVLQ